MTGSSNTFVHAHHQSLHQLQQPCRGVRVIFEPLPHLIIWFSPSSAATKNTMSNPIISIDIHIIASNKSIRDDSISAICSSSDSNIKSVISTNKISNSIIFNTIISASVSNVISKHLHSFCLQHRIISGKSHHPSPAA